MSATETVQTPDTRVVDKVRKLLAKANDRGVGEAEASAFAAKAAEIMEQHGLTQLQVERDGGEGEARQKRENASAFGVWYGPLMKAVAESCFCYCEALGSATAKRTWFTLIGRQSAVVSAEVLYEYLRAAIWRMSREHSGVASEQRLFRHGCAERVTERLRERHQTRLREQKEEAERQQREAAARRTHPGAAPSSTALVVTLVDHAQREADLNADFARGVAPGTTAQEREKRELQRAQRDAEFERLQGEGLSTNVAWRMAYLGDDRETAESEEEAAAARREKRTAESSSSWTRADERRERSEQRRRWREMEKRANPAFRAGAVAGEKVGLDQQIGAGSRKTKPAPTPESRRIK
jgi:hypothetical protein